jgi:hypothetical protein
VKNKRNRTGRRAIKYLKSKRIKSQKYIKEREKRKMSNNVSVEK